MADDVKVSVGLDSSPLVAGLSEAKSAVNSAASTMSSAFDGVAGSFGKITGALGAMTALLAGGSAFKSAISATVEWDGTSAKLAKSLGITTQQASVYQTALRTLGVDSSVLSDASLKLSKQLAANEGNFEKLGISTRDASGDLRPMNDILTDSLDRLREIQNPIDRNAAGMALFGKSWGEVQPLLKLTSDAMGQAAEKAKELGLVTSGDAANSAKQYKQAMNELGLTVQAFSIAIGRQLLPVLTQTASALSGDLPRAAEIIGTAFKGTIIVVETLWNSLQKVGLAIGAYEATLIALLRGDFGAAKAIAVEFNADIDKLNQKLGDFYEKMAKPPQPPKIDTGGDTGDSGELDDLKKDKKTRQETIEQLADYAIDLDTRVTNEHARLIGEQQKKDQSAASERERQIQELSDYAQELDTRVTKEHAKAVADQNKLDQDAAKRMQQAWAPVSNALQGAFAGMLNGTQTITSAMKSLWTNLFETVIQGIAKVAAEWLIQHAITMVLNMQEGKSAAGTAAANAAKSAATIPVIGWILAPIAAAATYAAASAGLVSASGGYDIGPNTNPLVQAHASEMILPASLANAVRDMAAGGGRSRGGTIHLHGNSGTNYSQDQVVAALKNAGHQFKLR